MTNKFLNRTIKPKKDRKEQAVQHNHGTAYNELEEFASCWASLDTARAKMRRSVMYAFDDQWGDPIKDPNTGEIVTEGELIKRQGKVPLKNNLIAPIIKNIDGQFRSNISKTVCVVRDRKEVKIGEMMSKAIEYSHSLNEVTEVDSNSLKLLECGGYVAQRIEYGYNDYLHNYDAWVYNVNPSRLFFNTNMEDPRGWDMNIIGELFDMTIDQIVASFAKNAKDREYIEKIYGKSEGLPDRFHNGMQGEEVRNIDFYSTGRTDLCRVILGWKLESRDAYFYHDTLNGTWGFANEREKNDIDAVNKKRKDEALAQGVAPEDILLIEYEFRPEHYWYYRYLTPWGDVLQEGRSPYWHGQHNYVFIAHTLIEGKIFPFVDDFIDQQRALNRTMTLIDFIRSSSSKGVLIVDDTAFENMSHEEIIDEYVRYNGVIFARLKPGQSVNNVITQLNGSGMVAGDAELLSIYMKMISDISGVNSAMQGKEAASGTAASLYAQQTQNASLNLKGLFDSFKAFRKRRDVKLMQTIQQYYASPRHIEISGTDYAEESSYYDPQRVQDAQIDLEISEGTNTPTYQMLENEFLMKLFEAQAIDVKTMLDNSTYPFASHILESIKKAEEEMKESRQMPQIDPSLMQSIPRNALMQKSLDDNNAAQDDGQILRAS